MDEMKDLGLKLRIMRNDLGFTQDEIGEALGVSRISYGKFEIGEKMPTKEELKIIAKKMGATIEDIYRIEPTMEALSRRPIPRSTRTKYEAMLVLAEHGFSAQSIIDLTLKDVTIIDDVVMVKKTKLSIEEGLILFDHLNVNKDKVSKVKNIFFGQSKDKLNVVDMKKGFNEYLKRFKNKTLADINWDKDDMKPKNNIDTIDDMKNILASIKGRC